MYLYNIVTLYIFFLTVHGTSTPILIGFVVGFATEREDISQNTILFWKTGVCGGFTTFSTFSLEAYGLLANKSYVLAAVYIMTSVVFCILGIVCGKKLAGLVR